MPLPLEGTATMLTPEAHNAPVSILLVEDNEDDALLTLRAFGKSSIATGEVVVVRDGVEALDFLFARGQYEARNGALVPRLILLDVNLPRMDGIQLLGALRGDPRTRLIPVVMLTSSLTDSDLMRSYSLGANGYIRKPVNSSQFEEVALQVVRYWLGINRAPGEYRGAIAPA